MPKKKTCVWVLGELGSTNTQCGKPVEKDQKRSLCTEHIAAADAQVENEDDDLGTHWDDNDS